MISVIITSYKESKTIKKAIEKADANSPKNREIIVVAPDEETLYEAYKLKEKIGNLKIIKDLGNGKPEALNLAVSKSRGEVLVLTDGDVFVGDKSISLLVEPLKNKEIGAVSGRPVPVNDRRNKYGFWAYLLTEIANERRKRAIASGKRIFCSGYLFTIRKKLFPELKEDLLSEDGFISDYVYKKGHKIAYVENSEVYVKFPNNFSDWIMQKKRSAGGYAQLKENYGVEIRSLKKESLGAYQLIKYVQSIREFFWLIQLFIARVYLWFLIYRDIKINRKGRKDIWKRVESTK